MRHLAGRRGSSGDPFPPHNVRYAYAGHWKNPLVIWADTGQIVPVKATLAELCRDTVKLMKPVIDSQKTLVITDGGETRAKIVPLPNQPDRKMTLARFPSIAAM